MLTGTFSVPRVVEESVCRSSEDDMFTEAGFQHKIHSTALMPNIPFEQAKEEPYIIDQSIFINDKETKLSFSTTVICQNYLTCNYIGPRNLEFYGPKTKMGREFILVCRNGNPNPDYRSFGTESAIRGFNAHANENEQMPQYTPPTTGNYDIF